MVAWMDGWWEGGRDEWMVGGMDASCHGVMPRKTFVSQANNMTSEIDISHCHSAA